MPDENAQSLTEAAQNDADATHARRIAARARRAAALAQHPAKLQMKVQIASVAAPAGAAPVESLSETAGYLVAAGDSWFDYPMHDVLKELEEGFGYNIESAAHRGDPLELIAYQGGQTDKLAGCIDKVKSQGATPRAVLLSGGGDDIAGAEFGMLLNNALSAIGGWNTDVVDGVINQRIATALRYMLTWVTHYCQTDLGVTLPILVHGYDYPVPDGRGFLGGWPFPGPWLQPGFHEKLFTNLPATVALMHDVIDRFNVMVARIVTEPGFAHVHYIDVRNTLSTDLTNNVYQQWWANELHPTEQGFAKVAGLFAQELGRLPS